MKTNYHTHTTRCHHASGSDEEYVLSAIKGGYDELGFSDHTPWKYDSNFKGRIRMDLSDFDDYYQSIKNLQKKYQDQITIKIGLEVEYFPKYMGWLENFVKEKKLDYIILGNHFFETDEYGAYYGYECNDDELLVEYGKDVEKALRTGLYSYLAHPDLFMRGRENFDELTKKVSRQICEVCKELDIPLEYNLAGLQVSQLSHVTAYPHPEFFKIAKEVGNKVIIGVDAHDNYALENNYYYNQAVDFLDSLGIERVDQIKMDCF